MKKKIKDLTTLDLHYLCNKYSNDNVCTGCPLAQMEECYEIYKYHTLTKHIKEIENKYDLEQEIEVEDNVG